MTTLNNKYYGNANPHLLRLIDAKARRVCELGCGSGGLARAYKDINPGCTYVGVELFEEAAQRAREVADVVLVRNLQNLPDWSQDAELNALLPAGSQDCVVMGDVLEHLYDPAAVLKQAVQRLAPGGQVVASIPNVQYWRAFMHLLAGTWPQADQGLFDRTHIRWFARDDMLRLFESCGLKVTHLGTSQPRLNEKTQQLRDQLIEALLPAARLVGMRDEEDFRQAAETLQYVLVAVKADSTTLGPA